MKLTYMFLLLIITLSCNPSDNHDGALPKDMPSDQTDGFDKALAEQFGADDYGMKSYVMAFLKRGPNRDGTKEELDELQRLHMENIGKMAEEGKLILAGPFLESDYEIRGIYIFDTPSLDSAKVWTNSDPAIQKGSLEMELHPWYGSAALMNVNELHSKIAKINI